jgi:hypothetical protein
MLYIPLSHDNTNQSSSSKIKYLFGIQFKSINLKCECKNNLKILQIATKYTNISDMILYFTFKCGITAPWVERGSKGERGGIKRDWRE